MIMLDLKLNVYDFSSRTGMIGTERVRSALISVEGAGALQGSAPSFFQS